MGSNEGKNDGTLDCDGLKLGENVGDLVGSGGGVGGSVIGASVGGTLTIGASVVGGLGMGASGANVCFGAGRGDAVGDIISGRSASLGAVVV